MSETAQPTTKRRSFLRTLGGAATLGATSLALSDRAEAASKARGRFEGDPFTLGVASGDPLPDSVVLWTRLAPEPLEPSGGMPDQPVPVLYEVATDEEMRNVVTRGVEFASPDWAHSVHVDVDGLDENTEYYYRFQAGDEHSPVGQTKTAPAPDTSLDSFSFAFASCQSWPAGYYTAYEDMADDDLDLVIHLGDYIYEYPIPPSAGERSTEIPRRFNTEMMTLEQYRLRHALYKTDPDLQAAHAAFPWLVTWDDHEVENNYADEVSENNVPPENFLERRANAYKAYFEHMPLRPSRMPTGPDLPLYRRFTFGDLVEFNVLDTRQYRSNQTYSVEEADNPNRTILGDTQENWLIDGLASSTSQWNVLAQQVPFSATDENPDPDVENFGAGDKWDGYRADRDTVRDFMTDHRDLNPVVITGDVHRNYVYNIKADFSNPDSATVGTEYITTSITSFGNGTGTNVYGGTENEPWRRFYNNNRGYTRCTITPEQWRTDYRVVSAVTSPDAPVSTLASFVTEAGNPGAKLTTVKDTVEAPGNSIASTFETGDEGWTLIGDPEDREPTYYANGGNPGGYISGTDGSQGVTWYYSAPIKFLGERSSFYGGTLAFDLRQSRTDSQYENPEVVLRGDGTGLVYDIGDSSTHPGTEWTAYEVPLTASAGWRHDPSSTPASEAEMRSVLGNLAQLQIRGEYRAGTDSSDLDTVVMTTY